MIRDDVSAVIPTYNRAQMAARAVRSALQQTVAPREIIVVDDGSTDDTAEVLGQFGDAIRVVRQPNLGSSEARNTGVREASAPWIAFLDSDDVWRPNHVEQMTAALDATSGRADVLFCDATTQFASTMRYSTNGQRLFELGGISLDGPFEEADDGTGWAMPSFQPMMLQSSLIRRRAYLGLGGLRADLLMRHDTHFFFIACIGRPIVAVRNVGLDMTPDDGPGRLSVIHGEATLRYSEETVWLYEDVLRRTPVAGAHRREIRRRLARARLRLARLAAARRDVPELVRHTAKAARVDPRTVLGRAIQQFRTDPQAGSADPSGDHSS